MASRYLHANITKLSEKHLEQAIESLGKVANQRLRELERGEQRTDATSSIASTPQRIATLRGWHLIKSL